LKLVDDNGTEKIKLFIPHKRGKYDLSDCECESQNEIISQKERKRSKKEQIEAEITPLFSVPQLREEFETVEQMRQHLEEIFVKRT
jgi:hypothetical protein